MTKEKPSYSEAIAEIEEILVKIEQGDLDVDELTKSVKRVTILLNLCKNKLRKTEDEIGKILDGED